jgi:hypothetical protein
MSKIAPNRRSSLRRPKLSQSCSASEEDEEEVLPTFLYGSENWTLTASQRRRIEAAEMKLLRPLAGHTHNDHKTKTPYAAN